jgi:predicted lipoprotein with Yx(FWY)xxD motif
VAKVCVLVSIVQPYRQRTRDMLRNPRIPSWLAIVVASAALATVSGCGGDDQAAVQTGNPTATATEMQGDTARTETTSSDESDAASPSAQRPGGEDGLRVPAEQARLVVQDSEFGRVLFDANGQVVYFFENDRRNESNCTNENDCVTAWPPVLTQEEPAAGDGVDASLLGTIERSDGRLQVTYKGLPLYFYENEGPGEIRCHNVDLHGGLWWVVTPEGEPAD